jgi:hypothetical protein
MELVKFGLTIVAILGYLAFHLAKVWREQKEQQEKLLRQKTEAKAEETDVDRRIAEAQRRRREQQQEAALAAAGSKPRVAKKPIPIQVVETPAPAPKTRITYSAPVVKPPQSSAKLPDPPKPAPAAAGAALAGLGPVAMVAKRPVSPALAVLSAMLKDRTTLAAAFMLKEVFDKPVGQRKRTE